MVGLYIITYVYTYTRYLYVVYTRCIYVVYIHIIANTPQGQDQPDKMPLFGKKDSNKKIKKDGRDDRSPSVEDKYVLKDLLGT